MLMQNFRSLAMFTTVLVIGFMALGCEKSEIDPLFEKKKLTEIHGDGEVITVKVKLPLSQSTIGSYDASEILEDETLDEKEAGIFRRFWNGLKYKVYDTAVSFGIYNRVKYSFDYKFPDIDSKYIKAAKVNKIFFALEKCPEGESACVDPDTDEPVTLKFLDKLFLNVSAVGEDKVLDLENQDMMIDEENFNKASEKAFSSDKRLDALNSEQSTGSLSGNLADEKLYTDVNIARFENSADYQSNITTVGSLERILLLRLDSGMAQGDRLALIKRLKRESLRPMIQDFSLIGDNVYLEMRDSEMQQDLLGAIEEQAGVLENIGILSVEKCSLKNCALPVSSSLNMIPMLEKSNHIRFDTFLSLKSLETRDFRYSGFVELEIKLDLGI